jgi:hypothetical protein
LVVGYNRVFIFILEGHALHPVTSLISANRDILSVLVILSKLVLHVLLLHDPLGGTLGGGVILTDVPVKLSDPFEAFVETVW